MADLLNRLLNKYKYTDSIPVEIRNFLVKSRTKVLKSSLKAVGDMNMLYSFTVTIFFGLRKFGIRPSLGTSQFVAGAVSIITASAFIVGSVYASHQLMAEKGIVTPVSVNVKADTESDGVQQELRTYQFGVKMFIAKNVTKRITAKTVDTIAKELSRITGKNKVINLSRKQGKVKNNITGSIGKLGSKYFITVKIVDKKSMVLFSTKKRINSLDELKNACNDIAKELVNYCR